MATVPEMRKTTGPPPLGSRVIITSCQAKAFIPGLDSVRVGGAILAEKERRITGLAGCWALDASDQGVVFLAITVLKSRRCMWRPRTQPFILPLKAREKWSRLEVRT